MKIELCAASMEAILLARKYKFDRIELCQNLEQGGMTPSAGFIDYALACNVQTHVLIRPRPGGFQYTDDEIEVMLRDIRDCKSMGAHGVVVGVLNEEGRIHQKALESIMRQADGMEVSFHRAFDDLVLYEKGLETLIDCGVKRVLTSGLASKVDLGFENLKSMIKYADGRIEIMAGGGVNASNIKKLQSELQPDAIHFSATVKHELDEDSRFSETILQINEDKLVRLLKEIGKEVRF